MTLTTHRMSSDMFSALASGGGGAAAVRQLQVGRRSKNLMLIRFLVHLATASGHPEATLARDAYRSLSLIQTHAPRAVETMLDYPSVGVWAVLTSISLMRGDLAQAQPGRLAAVAAAAAVRGAVDITIELPAVDVARPTIALPSLGTACVPGAAHAPVQLLSRADGAILMVGADVVTIPLDPHRDSLCWLGIRRISAECRGVRIDLLLDHSDCYPVPETIVAREQVIVRREVDAWTERVAAGWEVLVHLHPDVAAEVAAAITVLVPLSRSHSGQTSVTFRDAFGCVAMSLPANGIIAALTLAHEVQHIKLNALMDLFPLVEETPDIRFYAPWRDDPRPLLGLLHGLYAHMGVTAFWRRQRHHENRVDEVQRAQIEFARWREASRHVARILMNTGKLTLTGERFVTITKAVLDGWCRDRVPDEAAARAELLAAQHRQRWHMINGRPD